MFWTKTFIRLDLHQQADHLTPSWFPLTASYIFSPLQKNTPYPE